MPTQYKLGDKTFVSTGDLEQDIAIIKENFPEVDVEALKMSVQGGPKSFLQKLIQEGKNKAPESLGIGERARLGFGNQQGISEYLDSKGIPHEFRGGELFLGQGENARPADPGIMDQLKMGFLQSLKETASDVAELPDDIMNMFATTVGGIGGTAAGSVAGPIGSGVGMVGGNAAGAAAAEKTKEGIGKALGVYKTEGEMFTPEVQREALIGGLSALPGAAYMTGKELTKKAANAALNAKIPQRIYASGTGLGKDLAEDPALVETLMEEGVTGSKKGLEKLSSDKMQQIGAQLRQALTGKEANYDEIVSRISNFENQFASGQRESAGESLKSVLAEFQDLFKEKTSLPLPDLNSEKIKLARAASSIYDNPDVKARATAKAQKVLADASRRTIEEKVPAARGLNRQYHIYDRLNESVGNLLEKEYKKPVTSLGLSDIGVGGGAAAAGGGAAGIAAVALKKAIETSPVQTKTGSFLYKLLKKAPKEGFKATPKTNAALQQMIKEYMQQQDREQ